MLHRIKVRGLGLGLGGWQQHIDVRGGETEGLM